MGETVTLGSLFWFFPEYDLNHAAVFLSAAALLVTILFNVVLAILALRADRRMARSMQVLEESLRPMVTVSLVTQPDPARGKEVMTCLALHNHSERPALRLHFKFRQEEVDAAFAVDPDDPYRQQAMRSLLSTIPIVENGHPVLRPFGLQDLGVSGRPKYNPTWKHDLTVHIAAEYRDFTGKIYTSSVQGFQPGDQYWFDDWDKMPDRRL